MARKRKKKGKGNLTLILVIAGVAVLGGVVWYIMKKRKEKKEKKEKKDKINQHIIIPPAVNPPVSTTPVSTTTGYIYPQPNVSISTSGKKGCSGAFNTTSFPLQKYSCGDNVAKLQAYIGATADGKFGTATEKAVKSHQNLVVPKPVGWSAGYGKVSETDFINLKI